MFDNYMKQDVFPPPKEEVKEIPTAPPVVGEEPIKQTEQTPEFI